MLIKEIALNDITYQIEIAEVDKFHFWSQNIAVAKAYAKAHDVWYYPLLERLAIIQAHEQQTEQDKTLTKIWALAFNKKD